MGSSVEIGRTKLIALCVAGAVAITVVGIACWFGRGPPASDTSGVSGQSGTPVPTSPPPAPSSTTGTGFLPGTEPWLNLYLPKSTIPIHYDLTLYPDFYGDNAEFYGNVTIEIDVTQASRHLLVHIKRLDCKVTSITNKLTNKDYGIEKQWGYEPNQFWIVKTRDLIEESSTVLLSIQFSGSLSDGIVGFYKAFYANNTKAMATSKFQPVDARKAFPCFDEPNLKSTYTTTLVHQADYTPLSNMPVQGSSVRTDGLTATIFEKSVPMSTYLACFIVCKCTYKELNLTRSGKPFRVYAVEGSEDQIDYSLEFGANVTDYFEDYFGVDYPLPKMDMIAIPDFVSGAMEHWGLITYRETNLLYKEGVSSPANKQRIAEVVAHELAHMWFGNLVTMDWWDDLWLNEGFATFMSYVGTEPFEPGFEVFSQFAPLEVFTVMPEDSVASSHPILVPVSHPDEITAVFDTISYNKGASVIRMLRAFVGEAKFKQGLTEYMKRYKYGNTKTYQLWDSISENIENLDIELIMDTWTRQSGFPLVTIEYDSATKKVKASQQIFKDPDETNDWPESPFQYKWEVPLHYTSSSGDSQANFKWIGHKEDSTEFDEPIDLTVDTNWLKFNKDNSAYYKVNYPAAWWSRYGALLGANPEVIPVADRAGLVNDAATLPTYGFLNYTTALEFLTYLTNETHYVPWISVSSQLHDLRHRVNNKTLWNEFVVQLTKKSYDKLAWKAGGSHLDQLLKGTVIRLACSHVYSQCLESAQDKFTQWLADPTNNPLDANLRRDVYYYGMMNVTVEQWDKVWTVYNSEPVASAKVDMRRGLSRSKDPALINKYLDYAMDRSKIPDQDFFSVVSYLSGNEVALPIVWDWATSNYEILKQRFGLDNRYFGRMIPRIAEQFSTQADLDKVSKFFLDHPDAGSGKRPREQAIEVISQAIAWKRKYSTIVDDWLASR